jgi:outer membrane murein-binding lipoprotein Lpp
MASREGDYRGVAKRRIGVLAAVLAVALAGCGSTPKSRFLGKLNKMCEDFARREQKIGTPGSPSELRTRGDRIVAAYQQALVKPLDRLKAPPELATEAAQLRQIAHRQLNVLGALAVAGKAGDVARIQRLATANQQLNRQAAQIARALKADSCAS